MYKTPPSSIPFFLFLWLWSHPGIVERVSRKPSQFYKWQAFIWQSSCQNWNKLCHSLELNIHPHRKYISIFISGSKISASLQAFFKCRQPTDIIALKWGINKPDVHRMKEKLACGNYPFYFISLHNLIFFVLTLFDDLDEYTYLIIVKFLCCFMFIFSLSQRNVFVFFTFKIST